MSGEVFIHEAEVLEEWIDHNGHMRDAYYGLVFSYAGVAAQEEIGFDPEYRARTGCTIYLLEDHKFFLKEVKQGQPLRVETLVLDSDCKRFLLWLQMFSGDTLCAVAEYMELHVQQHPQPHAAPIPDELQARLRAATADEATIAALPHRSRRIGLIR